MRPTRPPSPPDCIVQRRPAATSTTTRLEMSAPTPHQAPVWRVSTLSPCLSAIYLFVCISLLLSLLCVGTAALFQSHQTAPLRCPALPARDRAANAHLCPCRPRPLIRLTAGSSVHGLCGRWHRTGSHGLFFQDPSLWLPFIMYRTLACCAAQQVAFSTSHTLILSAALASPKHNHPQSHPMCA